MYSRPGVVASYRIVAWEATADGHACVRPSSRAAPTGLVVRRAASARDGAPRRGIARRTVHRGGLATRGHRTARTALTGDSRARNISGPGNAGPGAPGYRRNFGILSPKPVKRTSYRSVTVSASIFIWSQPPAPLRGRSENYAIRVHMPGQHAVHAVLVEIPYVSLAILRHSACKEFDHRTSAALDDAPMRWSG